MYICFCVYMYICVYMHVYIYICVCMYMCVYMFLCVYYMCMYVYICLYLYVFTCVCVYVFVCIRVCVFMCTCVCICVYVHMCICVNVYMCICVFMCYMNVCTCVFMCLCRNVWTPLELPTSFRVNSVCSAPDYSPLTYLPVQKVCLCIFSSLVCLRNYNKTTDATVHACARVEGNGSSPDASRVLKLNPPLRPIESKWIQQGCRIEDWWLKMPWESFLWDLQSSMFNRTALFNSTGLALLH